mgnify:CR=1 FL=1|tara:strand:+ start:2172 stop:2540 length:369 start_codon:yes stop_codon:yes gene_type:complete
MATRNTFNRATKSSISTNDASPSTIYTVGTNETSLLTGCLIANKGTNPALVSVYIDTDISNEDDAFLCYGLQVPANGAVELSLGKVCVKHDGSGGDVIKAYTDALSSVDIIISILENVNQST